MLIRRIVCCILIAAAAILYLFSNETVTLALLITAIAVPAASLGLLRFSGRNISISLEGKAPSADHRNVLLTMTNPDIIPVASVDVEVRCVNKRTGETDVYRISRPLPPKGSCETELEVIPGHAGRYVVSIVSAEIADTLGIWSKKAECSGEERLTVMPEMFDIQLAYTSSAAMLENDRYRAHVRGNDPGDITGIKEYVPGDPVRNIHWKLTEKTDKLLVKELGNPVTDQFLVILDTAPDIAQDPFALDAAASVYASVIQSILNDGYVLSAAWTDPDTGKAVIRKIQDETEASAAADEYLAVPSAGPSAFGRIERDIAESRYAHIIIVGSRIPEGIEAITNGCQVTLLLYGAEGSTSETNLTIAGFHRGSYQKELAGIEV